ncbi:MAG TPA: efflux RND transporter periplasmic adaptor subunit [Terriglobales bacterium]
MKNRMSMPGQALARTAGLLPLLLAAVMFSSCSKTKVDPPQTSVETNADPNVFTLPHPEQFPTVAVEVRRVSDELHVNGVIAPDVNRSVPVVSLGGGRVVEIKAKLGDSVRKGQTLLLIDSPDVSQAFSDYQKFKADEQLAAKQLARAQLLYDKGAIALADLETAQDADAKAKVDMQTAVQRVKVLGGTINNPSPLLPVVAPISGTIVDQQITGGTGVKSLDNSPSLFTIADLSTVWVVCDVYQDMLSRVHVGDTAEISLNAYPDQKFPGKVVNISEVLDPATRSAKVRIELPNPKGLMRAGMFVTATFKGSQLIERIVVPATSIVHLHDKDWVFVPAGNKQFRRVTLQLGPQSSDGFVQVVSGLNPQEKVVTNALQFSSAAEEQ